MVRSLKDLDAILQGIEKVSEIFWAPTQLSMEITNIQPK